MKKMDKKKCRGRVLYVGQSYYHAWYLSRELRKIGWKADVLNWDPTESNNRLLYHGQDFSFKYGGVRDFISQLIFFIRSFFRYDVFHFSNAHCMKFGRYIDHLFRAISSEYSEVKLLRAFGKKIVYSNNGCLDGVAQSIFSKWPPESVCSICYWRDMADVCSDKKNLKWGKIRNSLADYQVTVGGNRVDYNNDVRVHEVPEFYCLDHKLWDPGMPIPKNYEIDASRDTVKIYHAVGNFKTRTNLKNNVNIKCSHIYIPLVERLKAEGYKAQLIFCQDIPNKDVRYYQAQADIVVDMLTFGWFGANIREGMMLGKPCVCFLRPEWIESVRMELPKYIEELPVINATIDSIYDVLKDLIRDPAKRKELGRRSREFAVKWHSAEAGARKFDLIYSKLLQEKDR
jgi:glycosyltransferase involved in cell wall biosynthesis